MGSLGCENRHPTTQSELARFGADYASHYLTIEIDFSALDEPALRALLGGVLPVLPASEGTGEEYPYGTLKTGFLLRREPSARQVVVEIETFPWPQLYPMAVEMRLHGMAVGKLSLAKPSESGHRIEGSVPEVVENIAAMEVVLRTDSFATSITDHRMKSYRLISAYQH